jgi:hypothetical protein
VLRVLDCVADWWAAGVSVWGSGVLMAVTPRGAASADRLKRYWTKDPEGLAKWRDKPHPWTSLYRHLLKYLPEGIAKRTASAWFEDVFGYPPGARKGKNPTGPG